MFEAPFSFTCAPGREGGTQILKLSGPLTLTSIFSFQDELRKLTPPVLILDLADSAFMDSAGLGVIMNAFVSAQNNHRKLLLASVNARIDALLELTRVKQILSIYPTVADAEASL